MMMRETAAKLPASGVEDSSPAGGGDELDEALMLWSKASRLVRPARVSSEPAPSGRKNAANLAIAPEVVSISRACRMWVVARHEGPRT